MCVCIKEIRLQRSHVLHVHVPLVSSKTFDSYMYINVGVVQRESVSIKSIHGYGCHDRRNLCILSTCACSCDVPDGKENCRWSTTRYKVEKIILFTFSYAHVFYIIYSLFQSLRKPFMRVMHFKGLPNFWY